MPQDESRRIADRPPGVDTQAQPFKIHRTQRSNHGLHAAMSAGRTSLLQAQRTPRQIEFIVDH
jgi:hypothetical protein